MRSLYLLAGGCFLALGVAGAVLPVLPTTPFVLLAAGCFARSSERLHGWLLSSPAFGPLIQEWRRTRTIPLPAKRIATVMIAGSLCISAVAVSTSPWHFAAFALLGIVLIGSLWRFG